MNSCQAEICEFLQTEIAHKISRSIRTPGTRAEIIEEPTLLRNQIGTSLTAQGAVQSLEAISKPSVRRS